MFTNLISLFFPEVCCGCHEFLLVSEHVICAICRHDIPLTKHHLSADNEAAAKFYGKLPTEFVATMCYFHKKGIVQEMIHKLKYKGHEEIGSAIGYWYGEDLKSVDIIRSVDEIIPVPLHKKRLKERGYNQVTSFANALSDSLGIPLNDKLLVRNVYSKTQTRKDRLGRSANSQSVFDVNFSEADHNKHFLIVDDVLTTGATLESCGRAIRKIPGAKISIVCIAMSHS
ncbi:MAG: ComF family protein [Flavobacterium sp.]|nr:MAG: ComF family protein [Flavobacterium sp.]